MLQEKRKIFVDVAFIRQLRISHRAQTVVQTDKPTVTTFRASFLMHCKQTRDFKTVISGLLPVTILVIVVSLEFARIPNFFYV